jgi:hypothetical protein
MPEVIEESWSRAVYCTWMADCEYEKMKMKDSGVR